MNARTVTATAALALLAALTLTGCAEAASNAAENRSSTPTTETAAPLVAETAEAEEPTVTDVEATFLDAVRATLPAETQIPDATDEQLLAAGVQACERLAAGESSDAMSLIEGETPNGLGYFTDSGMIITAARQTICPA